MAPHACWWLDDFKRIERAWQAASARGQAQLAKVADCVQKTTYLEGEHWGILSDCTDLHERASSRLWELAHRSQRRLLESVDELAAMYAQMNALLAPPSGTRKLDEPHRRRYGMFEQELVAKSLVSADIFDCRQHDTMTLYLAAWQMQPHIDKERIDEIEKLVLNDAHYRL